MVILDIGMGYGLMIWEMISHIDMGYLDTLGMTLGGGGSHADTHCQHRHVPGWVVQVTPGSPQADPTLTPGCTPG